VRRFGWSNVSQTEAQRMADERAQAALAEVKAGRRVRPSEPKVAYNGAEGVPIREEIIHEHGEVVITRNSYGALCLNTPNVYFADVDFERQPWRENRVFTLLFTALIIVGFCQAFLHNWWISVGVALILSPLLTYFGKDRFSSFFDFTEHKEGQDKVCQERIRAFAEAHPHWRLHVYRTPAGFRLLATHALFDPASDEVAASFKELGVDKLYAHMCRRQQCFRARVSPKPWRIGIDQHLKPRPGVWPVNPERLPERQRWVWDYEERARDFAACQFVETLGQGAPHAEAERVRQLHDDYCQATSGRQIA